MSAVRDGVGVVNFPVVQPSPLRNRPLTRGRTVLASRQLRQTVQPTVSPNRAAAPPEARTAAPRWAAHR
ncbi:hypothetical protein [Fodinicola feengrottensis]|uniref:hypothetical protein n=1 Tax=Fodinicola feengrottensis TaxID=435914 RepID=UPI0024410C90|nr:hypothetical protein [Fodinicola feengrottensis]